MLPDDEMTAEFLPNLAIVLGVAAVTTVIFQKLRQPVLLGYLLAGMVVGPHVPVPIVADVEIVHALAELGVILLMFSIGLELTVERLARVGPVAVLITLVQVGAMLGLGSAAARLLGWSPLEAFTTGAMIAVSSTTIVVRTFEDLKIRGKLADLVYGILVVQDLVAILLLAILSAVAAGQGVTAGAVAGEAAKLLGLLVAIAAAGMLLVPRAVRKVAALGRAETLLVASVGFCFVLALLAQKLGYSVALGAFLAGSLVGESGESDTIEPLLRPLRDVFAAIFFVAVGMEIDPAEIAVQWPAILLLTTVVLIGATAAVGLGAFLTGHGTRTSVGVATSLAQIGEFSFLIAGVGVATGRVRGALPGIAVAVSGITMLATPLLVRRSGALASWLDAKMPRPVQTFLALYGTWVERLRAPSKSAPASPIGHLVRLLALDAILLGAVAAGAALGAPGIARAITDRAGGSPAIARGLVYLLAAVLAAPLVAGLLRVSRRLGLALAERALPPGEPGKVDLADASRRAFVVTLQMGVVLLVGIPLAVATSPFLPAAAGALLGAALLVVLSIGFWRSAMNLQGHLRAGAEVVLAVLASGSARAGGAPDESLGTTLETMLPGLGPMAPLRLADGSPACGRTLAEVNLRGLTGATVLAIRRGEEGVCVPSGNDRLSVGDLLIVSGTAEALAAARGLLAPLPAADLEAD